MTGHQVGSVLRVLQRPHPERVAKASFRRRLSFLGLSAKSALAAGILLFLIAACAANPARAGEPSGCARQTQPSALLDRQPSEFPFDSYEEWLAFMDRAPDPAWRADAMSKLVSQGEFDKYLAGAVTRAERFQYLSDGLRINALIVSPKASNDCFPVVIYAHGGVAEWGRLTFFDVLEMHRLAAQGYIVLASMRRGEGGSEGAPNMGKGDLADMLTLIEVVDTLPSADPNRLAYLGYSRGGALGYRVLAASDRLAAAIMIGAPTDYVTSRRRDEFHQHVFPDIVDGYEHDADDALRTLSALYWPERLDPDVGLLLLHGAADERVAASDSLELAAKLLDLGRPVAVSLYENGSHSLIEHRHAVREEMDDWLQSHL